MNNKETKKNFAYKLTYYEKCEECVNSNILSIKNIIILKDEMEWIKLAVVV